MQFGAMTLIGEMSYSSSEFYIHCWQCGRTSKVCCILLLEFFLPVCTRQLDLITKKNNDEHLYIRNIIYFLYFSGLLRMWRLKDKNEVVMSAYRVLTGDLFTKTVSRDSTQTSEHGYFYKHIYSRMTTHLRSATRVFFFQLTTPVHFCFWDLLSAISVALYVGHLIFLFQCITNTWLNDLSTCHSFPISESLCHDYPLSF